MTAITERANTEYRDFESPGSTDPHEPIKAGIRLLFTIIDTALGSLGVNGAITVKKATRALLYADLSPVADTLAIVYNDATQSYNGIYAKSGGTGAGSWVLTPIALPASFATDISDAMVVIQSARDEAVAAAVMSEQAYQDILQVASGAPDAPSVLNKAQKDASNLDDAEAQSFTERLVYDREVDGSVPSRVNLNLGAYAIRASTEFGVVMDGTDKSVNVQKLIRAAFVEDKEIWYDASDEDGIPINTSMIVRSLVNLPYATAFRRGIRMRGTGPGGTVFNSSVANGALFDFSPTDDFTSFKGQLGGLAEGITIRRTTPAANSDGFRMRSLFQFDLSDTHVIGLTGTAYRIVCTEGDRDGSNMITMARNRAENCLKWGFDFEATSPNNEISHLTTMNCVASGCGTAQSVVITGITQANPAVVTAPGHGLQNGERVYLMGVGGMTQIDSLITRTSYVVSSVTANTFQLSAVNSTAYSAFTSGGRALPFVLTSGGWKWRGQKWDAINCGGVQNHNANLWLPGGAGLQQDFLLDFASENPASGWGDIIQGGRNGRFVQPHLYSNQSFSLANYGGFLIDATTAVVRNVQIDQPMVRATAAESNYRALLVMGAQVDVQSIEWNDPDYKQYDFAGQSRVVGLLPESCPIEGELLGVAATALRYRPSSRGNRYPLKMAENSTVFGGTRSTTGELTTRKLAVNGINLSNSGLAVSQIYQIYVYDASVSLGRDALEASTTAAVQDTAGGSGRMIKTGDDTRTWVGRWATDGSGQWLTGAQNWLNPWFNGAWFWTDSTGDLRTKATLPTSDLDGTVVGTQT